MAAGDGAADLVGRRWGKRKWPWSQSKSIVGSGAFAVAGFAVSMGLILWFVRFGCLTLPAALSLKAVALRVAVISLACAAVELLPGVDDNISVPMAGCFLAHWLIR